MGQLIVTEANAELMTENCVHHARYCYEHLTSSDQSQQVDAIIPHPLHR